MAELERRRQVEEACEAATASIALETCRAFEARFGVGM